MLRFLDNKILLRHIIEQTAPPMSEICVVFPLQNKWQRLEEVATHNKTTQFIADPPWSPVEYIDMTPIQQFAIDLGNDDVHRCPLENR